MVWTVAINFMMKCRYNLRRTPGRSSNSSATSSILQQESPEAFAKVVKKQLQVGSYLVYVFVVLISQSVFVALISFSVFVALISYQFFVALISHSVFIALISYSGDEEELCQVEPGFEEKDRATRIFLRRTLMMTLGIVICPNNLNLFAYD